MQALHQGSRDKLEISPNLWAGVGLVRGGAGTALVGDPESVAARMREYAEVGIETFIFSGYPHLEEAYRVAELLFPLLPLESDSERTKGIGFTGPTIGRGDHRQQLLTHASITYVNGGEPFRLSSPSPCKSDQPSGNVYRWQGGALPP